MILGGRARVMGAILLLGCAWWAQAAARDLASVSPVHWGLLLPHLAVAALPALLGTSTAAGLLFGRPGARALAFAFLLALAQAAAISRLAPEIDQRYSQAVQQGKALIRDSLPTAGRRAP